MNREKHSATAIALIAWALMLPRYDLDGRVEDKALLSEWKIHSTYESRDDCERVRDQMVEVANEFIAAQERRAEMDGIPEASVMLAAKCVGT
ncbi:MAG: hypothetical protein Q7S58_13175 [Candidatus Binatus sp.]|uniref:hypothetical protein n=1 Tax=Candidatus Binatus sp. TaxID=2811406 RepID=UPI002717D32F|nr:hypothetical protein [Candidatus Binatus sp.]MDO8433351.1 hypothetical protein [Candidatus Binatus sp.]